MADRIAVMHEGRIQQLDSAYNLYHRPRNRFVADFIGRGVPRRSHRAGVAAPRPRDLGSRLRRADPPRRHRRAVRPGERVDVLLRPDDVVHDDASAVKAMVRAKAFRGAEILYTLQLASGATVLSLVPSHHNHTIGEPIGIRLELDHVIAFAPQRQPEVAAAATAQAERGGSVRPRALRRAAATASRRRPRRAGSSTSRGRGAARRSP